MDSHCTSVPTTYNSYWMQVWLVRLHCSPFRGEQERQGFGGNSLIFYTEIRTVSRKLRTAKIVEIIEQLSFNFVSFQGCLPKVSSLASEYTSMIILVIISVLTVEIVVIILACCLCFLQKYRRDKNCQRIIVTKETSQQHHHHHSPQERNNWSNSSLRDERKNLIYTEAMNDGVP